MRNLMWLGVFFCAACSQAAEEEAAADAEPAFQIPSDERGQAHARIGDATLIIDYGRPTLQGRDMLSQLAPGQVWRLGMNEATMLNTNADLAFDGTVIEAGQYSLFAKSVGENDWRLLVNSEVGIWGTAHNPENDVAEIPMQRTALPENIDQLTIEIVPTSDNAGQIVTKWSTFQLEAPFIVDESQFPFFNRNKLTVLVYFYDEITHLGVSKKDLLSRLQVELNQEFDEYDIQFVVKETSTNFRLKVESTAAAWEENARKRAAWRTLQQLRDEHPEWEEMRYAPDVLSSAAADWEHPTRSVETRREKTRNLAELQSGHIGLVIEPTDKFGGATIPGELWSSIYTGQLAGLFPPPNAFLEKSPSFVDFTSEQFARYKESYTNDRRKDYILQYIVNAAKRELGKQFGLSETIDRSSLQHVMFESLDVQNAEHLFWAQHPVQFDRANLEKILPRLRSWAQSN